MNTELPTTTAEPEYFRARDIARALTTADRTVDKKFIQRLADREEWPMRIVGNRMEYCPPAEIAQIIVSQPDAQQPALGPCKVRFSDLAHSDLARAKTLFREEAVKRFQATKH